MKNTSALLIVDLQNDFLSGGALAVPHGDRIIPHINQLIPHFKPIITTQDWHPPGHISFASSHEGKQVGDCVETSYGKQILWPNHCLQESVGAECSPLLILPSSVKQIHKGYHKDFDSYSGFFDSNRQTTGLHEYLSMKAVQHLFVVGLATEYCVLATVLDACQLGYQVKVIQNACEGIETHLNDVSSAWQTMEDAGAQLTTTQNVLK
ncbi:Bifunctional nicotinamidase/pyrazinamidase [Planctomycetales bacterium 10988]|nr:Bifunctional nicotinamidase/pyrazinamidase [Planctomycetales bacterium 10988]